MKHKNSMPQRNAVRDARAGRPGLRGLEFRVCSRSCGSDAPSSQLRLYVLDCGTISAMDPALFGLKANEVNRDVVFVTPCYLIVHPKGTLIWDVGQVPDQDIPDDGTEVVQQGILKAKRRLAPQLAAIGYQPKDITYIAMSHYHADHTANANLFAHSTWIVQQAEYDIMFSERASRHSHAGYLQGSESREAHHAEQCRL